MADKQTMKALHFLHTMVLLGLIFVTANAQEITVVDVRRNITLAEDDIVYKDYYLNAGSGSALKKNMVVNAKRKINVRDAGTKSVGDFETVVGQLKIIHLGEKVAVAREFKLISRDEEPMLEQIGIMSGDRIDLKDSFIDTNKPAYKRKSAEVTPAEETPVASVVVVPVAPAPPTAAAILPVTPNVAPTAAPAENRVPAAQSTEAVPPVKAPVTLPQI